MAAIERLIALFEIEGQQAYIGEPVSQWSHASQAAEAALGAGASEAVILSALLHDIGHLQYQHSEKMADTGFAVMSGSVLTISIHSGFHRSLQSWLDCMSMQNVIESRRTRPTPGC